MRMTLRIGGLNASEKCIINARFSTTIIPSAISARVNSRIAQAITIAHSESMDTIQPPILEPAQDSQDHEKPLPQTVANQGKHSDTRVALSVKEKRGFCMVTKRATPKVFRRVGPAKWALAMRGFVNGELSTLQAVAEYLGTGFNTVREKAKREGWFEARNKAVQAVLARVGECDGVAVVKKAEDLASIASAQADLATWVLNHGKAMSSQAEAVAALVQSQAMRVAELEPKQEGAEMVRRMAALNTVHCSLVDTIRVLAGLPHPDRQPRQAIAKPKPVKERLEPRTRAMTAPLGADPEAIQSAVGEGEEEGVGGGSETVPAPLG